VSEPSPTVGMTARAWVQATHPGPSLVVASLTGLFAWGVGLDWSQVGVVFVAMLANQTGIGLSNDWWDAPRDTAVGRADKPIANGVIARHHVRNTAVALGVAALIFSASLGLWPAVCQVVMLASGWWYNLHAKGHWSSVVSYLVGFSLLPVFPALALSPASLPPWWVIVVAGLLGGSAHFANALPDLSEDRVSGVRGLPQRVGARASGLALSAGVISATALIAVFGEGLPPWVRVVTTLLALVGIGIATRLSFSPKPPRIIFPLTMLVAAVCAVAIALGVAAG